MEIAKGKLHENDKELLEILKDEINVKEVRVNATLKEPFKLDTIITPELKEEGVMREFVRVIQGLRQDANLVPKDKIAIMADLGEQLKLVVQDHEELLKREVGAESIEYKKSDKFNAEISTDFDGNSIWIGISKL